MSRRSESRSAWVSYLRVSTPEQAERDLSLPAQRHSVAAYAEAHSATTVREYLEEGHSGTDPHRPVFRQMLEDAVAPHGTATKRVSSGSKLTDHRASVGRWPTWKLPYLAHKRLDGTAT